VAEALASSKAQKHRQLFRLAYGVLALAFWISVGGFVLLVTRAHHSASASSWSTWKPDTQGLAGAREIGLRISSGYMSANGTQLVAVQEHSPQVQGLKLEAIGVRRLNSAGQIDPYIGLFHADKTLIYAFCGLEANCSIEGSSTAQSQRALRREALELSLYAFKYLHDVDQVVSLLEPVKNSGTSAVFLRKSDLKPELDHPLRDTLPLATPPVDTSNDAKEAPVIDALTSQATFPAHFEPLPDGDAILVLDIAAQTPTQ
jgi:hypothetical protein